MCTRSCCYGLVTTRRVFALRVDRCTHIDVDYMLVSLWSFFGGRSRHLRSTTYGSCKLCLNVSIYFMMSYKNNLTGARSESC